MGRGVLEAATWNGSDQFTLLWNVAFPYHPVCSVNKVCPHYRPSAFCHLAASSGKDLVSRVPWNQDKRLDSSSMMIRNERKDFQTKLGHFKVKPLWWFVNNDFWFSSISELRPGTHVQERFLRLTRQYLFDVVKCSRKYRIHTQTWHFNKI